MAFDHTLPRNVTDLFNHINICIDERVQNALCKIYEQHNIDPGSRLGIILKNGLYKIIISMHHLHDAINDLNDTLDNEEKIRSSSSIKRLFHSDFLKACEHSKPNPKFMAAKERILCIESGRTKVVSTLLKQIREHSGKDLHGSFKILGSLIRQSIDIYRELGHAEFNFSKTPPVHKKNVDILLLSHRNTQKNAPRAA